MGLLHHTVVYEVDFPNVACQKAALIKGMKELSALVGDTGGEGKGMALIEDCFLHKMFRRSKHSFSLQKTRDYSRGAMKL